MSATDIHFRKSSKKIEEGYSNKHCSNSIIITLLIVMLGITFTVYCYYPGNMSSDSLDQYTQGRTGMFNDWHPPVMSYLWSLMDKVIPGPAGMLIFNNV